MAKLEPSTRLRRVPGLELQLEADGTVRVRWGSRRLRGGVHTLAILDAFRGPLAFAEGVKRLGAAGRADWVELTGSIRRLYEAGVLEDADAPAPPPEVGVGFGRPAIHIAMLNDRARTRSYLKAIEEVVRPGDVVVDLGTGTGVLAMAAARAGAARVHAIEANSAMARVARSAFERNGLAERITLHEGRSTQVELPRRADVLVSEIIGNDPFGEQILELTADAVKRLLEPDARLLPSRLEVYGLPVTIPEAQLARHLVTAGALERWRTSYGLDFSPLADMRWPVDRPLFSVPPHRAAEWPALGEALRLTDVDLGRIGDQRLETTVTGTAGVAGLLSGFLVYFETTLSAETRLSTEPSKSGGDSNWRCPVWAVSPPIEVRAGDEVTVRYQSSGPRLRCPA